MVVYKLLFVLFLFVQSTQAAVHPLRLSLCEIEYSSVEQLLTINLKLFLMDVNEALVFDPNSKELAFCQPNESANAEQLLLNYLNIFFYVKVNGKKVALKIKRKRLSGEGDNVALWLLFEQRKDQNIKSLEIKNAIFTDLFFDQNNVIYVYVNGDFRSLMLNKKTTTHILTF